MKGVYIHSAKVLFYIIIIIIIINIIIHCYLYSFVISMASEIYEQRTSWISSYYHVLVLIVPATP